MQVLSSYSVAREACAELLEREAPQSGDLMVALLRQRETLYKQLDGALELEMATAIGLSGSAGEKRLQDACLACLPSAEKATNFTMALAELGRLKQGDLHKLCSRSAQASMGAVAELVGNMQHGVAPEANILGASALMHLVKDRLEWFCTTTSEKGEAVLVVRGLAAVNALFALVDTGGDDEPLTFGQLQALHAFTFMATDAQKGLLAKAVKATLAAAATGSIQAAARARARRPTRRRRTWSRRRTKIPRVERIRARR